MLRITLNPNDPKGNLILVYVVPASASMLEEVMFLAEVL